MLESLKSAVLEWWEKHQYDTCGDYGDQNVYSEPPDFVRIALEMRDKCAVKEQSS